VPSNEQKGFVTFALTKVNRKYTSTVVNVFLKNLIIKPSYDHKKASISRGFFIAGSL